MSKYSHPTCWILVDISSVMKRVRNPVVVESKKLYREIGIRSHGKGLFYKDERVGESLGNKSVFWIEPDCFIVNIVFAWEQAITRTTKNEKGMIASHRFPMYKPISGKLDLDYIVYFFKSPLGKHLLGLASPGGAGRNKTLGQEEFNKLTFPLPPYNEQRKIAEILSTWDEAIKETERLIAALQTRKKGLMQRLLNGQVRFPGFDREWKEAKLEDCCDILDNQRIPLNNDERVNRQGNIPYYGANGILDYIDDNIFDEPLILIAEDGGYFDEASFRPICQLIDGKSWVNNHAHVLRAKPGNVREWIYYWFVHRNIVPHINGGTRSKLNQKDLRTLPIKLPTYDEQLKVSSFLKECDQEIKLHNEILSIYNSQKKGLMQRLLTGQVRVKLEQ